VLEFILLTALASDFPSYFKAEQKVNAATIIEKSVQLGLDPYFMVALAWTESRLSPNTISKTDDYGIFQINYRFWAKRWGYTNPQKFLKDMSSPELATVAAATVIKEMKRYRNCQGLNLPACYNGGPAWQKSKNKEKIIVYANKVNRTRSIFKRWFPGWLAK